MVSFAQPSIANFDDMKQKLQAYLHVYDGEVKSCREMEDVFEGLFHEAFSYTLYGRHIIDKEPMRDISKTFLSMGTKADLILYKPLDNCTFEVKLHFANQLVDLQTHLKGTVQDWKLIKLEAYKDAKPTHSNWQNVAGLSEAKRNFEHFVLLQNDKNGSLNDLQDAFDRLFYDSLAAAINRTQLHKRGMQTTSSVPDDFSQTRFALEMFEVIDGHHIEVKVIRDCVLGDCKSTREVWHDVLTVKDGTILMIEPYIDFKKGSANKGKLVKTDRSSCPPVFSQ